MPRHSVFLGTYVMFITEHRTSDRVHMHDIDGQGTQFLDWAATVIGDRTFHNAGADDDVTRYRTREVQEEQTMVYGRISCGDTGIAEELVDGATGEDGGEKAANAAGMVPHYFQLQVQGETDYAVLALSRLGVKGAYGYFSGPFTDKFREKFPERTLHIEPSIATEVLQALRTAPVRSIQFSSSRPRSDLLQSIIEPDQENVLTFRTTVTARRGKFVRLRQNVAAIVDSLAGARESVAMPVEWQGLGDRAAITLRVDGKRDRTITVGVGRDVVPYEEVHARAEDYDDRGWPKVQGFLHPWACTLVTQVRRRSRH